MKRYYSSTKEAKPTVGHTPMAGATVRPADVANRAARLPLGPLAADVRITSDWFAVRLPAASLLSSQIRINLNIGTGSVPGGRSATEARWNSDCFIIPEIPLLPLCYFSLLITQLPIFFESEVITLPIWTYLVSPNFSPANKR